VIVANGEFPHSERLIERIRTAEYVIACDGATRHLHKLGLKIDAIVGDLDSLPVELKDVYADKLHHISEQDSNDLMKAANFALSIGVKDILILGATGLREDHAFGNIAHLADCAKMFDNVEMASDYGSFKPLLKTHTFRCISYQQVSLIPLVLNTEVSTKGLKWELKNHKLVSWWEATLNESLSDSFTVELPSGGIVLVYLANDLK
jgi:thiamine pyrophosphokinase